MKSIPVFLVYLNKENKFQGTLWVCENPKVNITQKTPWESIYVNSSHEKMIPTSLLMLDAWLMNEGRIFFLISLVLWVVILWSIHYWFNFMLFNVVCGFLSFAWLICIILNVSCFLNVFIFMWCSIWLLN